MHLLYLDDAGSAGNKNEEYLVLGGISVFEAQASFLTNELDKIASGFSATNPHDIEFHASEIFSRRVAPWDKLTKEEAKGVLKAVLGVLATSYYSAKAFACVVHKPSYPGRDPLQMAFEDICSRFDRYLSRLQAEGDRQRGMIILDESSHETTLQGMARNFPAWARNGAWFVIWPRRRCLWIPARPAACNWPTMWPMRCSGGITRATPPILTSSPRVLTRMRTCCTGCRTSRRKTRTACARPA